MTQRNNQAHLWFLIKVPANRIRDDLIDHCVFSFFRSTKQFVWRLRLKKVFRRNTAISLLVSVVRADNATPGSLGNAYDSSRVRVCIVVQTDLAISGETRVVHAAAVHEPAVHEPAVHVSAVRVPAVRVPVHVQV